MDLFIGVIILFIVLNIVRMLFGSRSRRPQQRQYVSRADEWQSQPFNLPTNSIDSMPLPTYSTSPDPIIVDQPVHYGSPAPNVDTLGVAIGTAAAIGIGGVAAYEIEQAIDNSQNWNQPDQSASTFGVNFPDNSNYGTSAFDNTNAAFDPNAFAPQPDNSLASTPSFDNSTPSFDTSSFSTPSFDSSSMSAPSMDTSSMSSPSIDTSSQGF